MLRAVLTHTATWPLTALAVLAILLPIGMGSSQAAFVAQSTNPNQTFSAAASFNTVAVTLTDPGTPLRGVVMLNAVATSSRGMGTVTFETSPAGANTWTTACTASTSPYSCSWDTSTVTDGLRDVRAVATDSAGYTKTDTITNRRVDNTAPTPTTTDPGTPLTGTISVSGSAVDSGSGVASSTLQYRPSGGGSWTTICTAASSIVTCSWNTAALADGLYDLRTQSTDVAGNTGTSPIVANRRLDNIAPTATMTAPAANLTGSVTLASTSADGANGTGVASVRYEYKLSSGSTWATACTGLTTPFTCSFDTSTVADGLYDFRAVAIDGVAKTGTSDRGDLAPDRQHRADGDDDRAGGEPLGLGDAGLDRRRRRQRPRVGPVPVPRLPGRRVDERLLVGDHALLLHVRHHLGERRASTTSARRRSTTSASRARRPSSARAASTTPTRP